MSVQSQIDRINQNVANTYAVLQALGADMPAQQNSDNLAATAGSAKAVLYTPQTLTDPEKAQARRNMDALSKDSLSLGIASDGLIYLFVDGNPVGTGIPMGNIGDVYGYIDENNHIALSGNMPDGTYTASFEEEDGTIVALVGQLVKDTNVYYSVTNTLTNCTSNNSAKTVVEGGSYSATITANGGYEMSSIKVTMGGTDISSSAVSGGKITIANVTGKIVITAVAEEVQAKYTNLADPSGDGWANDSRLGSDGAIRTGITGVIVTNYIPMVKGDTVYVKGMDLTKYNMAMYNGNKVNQSAALVPNQTAYFSNIVATATGGQITYTSTAVAQIYVRFSGAPNGSVNDIIITKNEPIE